MTVLSAKRARAELTGKRHDHVLRDAEKMLAELGATSPQIWGNLEDAYGRPQRVAFLPERETLILVSGYSAPMRHRIVTRWMELEAEAAKRAADTSSTILRRWVEHELRDRESRERGRAAGLLMVQRQREAAAAECRARHAALVRAWPAP